jgi:antitoxin component of MazEF toxin-antitoxin module
MLEGVGRIKMSGRSIVVRLPKDLAVDSAFPFQVDDEVTVQIVSKELRVACKTAT